MLSSFPLPPLAQKLPLVSIHSGTSTTSNCLHYQSSCLQEAILSPVENEGKKTTPLFRMSRLSIKVIFLQQLCEFPYVQPLLPSHTFPFLPFGFLTCFAHSCVLFWMLALSWWGLSSMEMPERLRTFPPRSAIIRFIWWEGVTGAWHSSSLEAGWDNL